MTDRLTLRLTGNFEARVDNGPPLDLPLRCQAILAVLARSGRGTAPRGVLATLVWGDRGEEQARASLRQALSVLRRALPDALLEADRQEARLDLTRVDLVEDPGAEFLAGFELTSEPFEDWLRQTRETHRSEGLDQALQAAEQALANKTPDEAAEQARAALRADPLSEAALSLLMQAEAARGNRAGAILAFEQARERLMSALGVEPGAGLRDLCAELRRTATATTPAPKRAADRPSVAVMAFDDLTPGEADMFADGVVDEITSALSRVREFHVIARQSAFALRGEALGVPAAADRLGADYLVEGSVRRAGERVRIAVQLVRGRDGHTVWSQRFDDRLDDLFDLQDRIAAHVAGQLAPTLRAAEIARATRLPPESQSAYSLTLQALPHFWAHRRDDNARAITILDEALRQDPGYGPALAYKGWAVAQQPSYLWSDAPEADRALAQSLADQAAAATTDHAPSLVAIGATHNLIGDRVDLARSFVERALEIDANNAWGWLRLGWCTIYQERPVEALPHFAKAEELSPLDPFRFNMAIGRGVANWLSGEHEAGLDLLRKGMALAPGMIWANRLLASWYSQLGRETEAEDAMRALMNEYPGLTLKKLIAGVPPSLIEQNEHTYSALLSLGLPKG
ncbi:MAG: hypothetical protein HUJ27_03905 [Rhodobacteraceae bacterium]|nr:hypothetical protein [Paracoccaceae bacterium]